MSAKCFAEEMKKAVEDVKNGGIVAISCDKLIEFLDDVHEEDYEAPSPFAVARYEAELQGWVQAVRTEHDGNLEMFRSVLAAAQNSIKTSFLLNGGSAVALLAFIGHLAQFNAPRVAPFAHCLLIFGLGVFAIAIASAGMYFTQYCYARRSMRLGLGFHIACVILGLGSFGLFLCGLLLSYSAFQRL